MNILGIGPLELTLIVIIALIVLGPSDMVKTGRTLGRWLRKIVLSPEWKVIQNASREFRALPNRLIREAGIEEAQQAVKEQLSDIHKINQDIERDLHHIQTDLSSWVTPNPTPDSTQVRAQPPNPVVDTAKNISPEKQ